MRVARSFDVHSCSASHARLLVALLTILLLVVSYSEATTNSPATPGPTGATPSTPSTTVRPTLRPSVNGTRAPTSVEPAPTASPTPLDDGRTTQSRRITSAQDCYKQGRGVNCAWNLQLTEWDGYPRVCEPSDDFLGLKNPTNLLTEPCRTLDNETCTFGASTQCTSRFEPDFECVQPPRWWLLRRVQEFLDVGAPKYIELFQRSALCSQFQFNSSCLFRAPICAWRPSPMLPSMNYTPNFGSNLPVPLPVGPDATSSPTSPLDYRPEVQIVTVTSEAPSNVTTQDVQQIRVVAPDSQGISARSDDDVGESSLPIYLTITTRVRETSVIAGGTFTLAISGDTTTAIPWDASAAVMYARLSPLIPGLDSSDVTAAPSQDALGRRSWSVRLTTLATARRAALRLTGGTSSLTDSGGNIVPWSGTGHQVLVTRHARNTQVVMLVSPIALGDVNDGTFRLGIVHPGCVANDEEDSATCQGMTKGFVTNLPVTLPYNAPPQALQQAIFSSKINDVRVVDYVTVEAVALPAQPGGPSAVARQIREAMATRFPDGADLYVYRAWRITFTTMLSEYERSEFPLITVSCETCIKFGTAVKPPGAVVQPLNAPFIHVEIEVAAPVVHGKIGYPVPSFPADALLGLVSATNGSTRVVFAESLNGTFVAGNSLRLAGHNYHAKSVVDPEGPTILASQLYPVTSVFAAYYDDPAGYNGTVVELEQPFITTNFNDSNIPFFLPGLVLEDLPADLSGPMRLRAYGYRSKVSTRVVEYNARTVAMRDALADPSRGEPLDYGQATVESDPTMISPAREQGWNITLPASFTGASLAKIGMYPAVAPRNQTAHSCTATDPSTAQSRCSVVDQRAKDYLMPLLVPKPSFFLTEASESPRSKGGAAVSVSYLVRGQSAPSGQYRLAFAGYTGAEVDYLRFVSNPDLFATNPSFPFLTSPASMNVPGSIELPSGATIYYTRAFQADKLPTPQELKAALEDLNNVARNDGISVAELSGSFRTGAGGGAFAVTFRTDSSDLLRFATDDADADVPTMFVLSESLLFGTGVSVVVLTQQQGVGPLYNPVTGEALETSVDPARNPCVVDPETFERDLLALLGDKNAFRLMSDASLACAMASPPVEGASTSAPTFGVLETAAPTPSGQANRGRAACVGPNAVVQGCAWRGSDAELLINPPPNFNPAFLRSRWWQPSFALYSGNSSIALLSNCTLDLVTTIQHLLAVMQPLASALDVSSEEPDPDDPPVAGRVPSLMTPGNFSIEHSNLLLYVQRFQKCGRNPVIEVTAEGPLFVDVWYWLVTTTCYTCMLAYGLAGAFLAYRMDKFKLLGFSGKDALVGVGLIAFAILFGGLFGFFIGAIPAALISQMYASIPVKLSTEWAISLGVALGTLIVYFDLGRGSGAAERAFKFNA